MRRVIAISLAILVLAVGARGVMAQESEQQVSDRLLEILKDRQIISDDEYSELKDITVQMQEDRTQMDSRLDDIDRSIAEYLAQGGDARGANVSHKKGMGFGFATGDGFFSLWIGGLFQTWYTGRDNDSDAMMSRDTNSISVPQARLDFSGNAFDPNLTYRSEINFGSDPYQSGVLDLWGNWDIMEGAQVRFGQMKVPYGRQWSTYQGDLQFGVRNPITNAFTNMFMSGRDLGLMAWDAVAFQEGGEPVFDWYAGLFNGDGTNVGGNDNNWMAVLLRASAHPLGYLGYTEGDLDQSKFKFAVGATYYYTNNRPVVNFATMGTQTIKTDNWGIDLAMKVSGFSFIWEYYYQKANGKGTPQVTNWGWYAQAGFLIPNSNFEILGSYGFGSWDQDMGLDETWTWALGAAYYFDRHPFKIIVFFAQADTDEGDKMPVGGLGSMYAGTILEPVKTSMLNIAFQLDW